eukprot:m.7080 g.7080  ORF g.7080 m.7080 type:complete len:61 (+) comp5412_c0_seq2:46-228(+)
MLKEPTLLPANSSVSKGIPPRCISQQGTLSKKGQTNYTGLIEPGATHTKNDHYASTFCTH